MKPSELESKMQEQIIDLDLTPNMCNFSMKINGEDLEYVYRVEIIADWKREKPLMRIYFYHDKEARTKGILELDVTGNVGVRVI